jgi:hypothetical protein
MIDCIQEIEYYKLATPLFESLIKGISSAKGFQKQPPLPLHLHQQSQDTLRCVTALSKTTKNSGCFSITTYIFV